jgi:hypothetical protein
MHKPRDEPPPAPNERVERREVVERRDSPETTRARRDASYLIWLIPLALVVVALVWFIFTRGEPIGPVDTRDVEVTVPQVEMPRIEEERRIEVVPAEPEPEPAPQPQPPPQ